MSEDKNKDKPTITFDEQSVRDVARLYKEWRRTPAFRHGDIRRTKRTVGRTGSNACGDTSCRGTSVPSNVSSKQESPGFSCGERQKEWLKKQG